MVGLQGEWLCGQACPYYRRRLPRPKDEQDCQGRLGFDLARTSFATRTTRPRPLDSPLPRASRALACGVHDFVFARSIELRPRVSCEEVTSGLAGRSGPL